MNSQKLFSLFRDYRIPVQTIRYVWNFEHGRLSKGTRLMRKARKYQRPEDLVDPNYYGIGPKKEVQAALQSIEDRGFAKEQPSYYPPKDVEEQLQNIGKKVFGSQMNASWEDQSLNDPLLKFKVLTKCIQAFHHNIPNSFLHQMATLGDLLSYYRTPIRGCSHLDALVRDSDRLPPNLHISAEVHFHPDSDTFFDGVTAFPGRKRIVFGRTGEKFEKVVEWPNV